VEADVSAGRFVAALSGHALLDAVAEIARQAAAEPDLASAVSKRRFDLTRRALGRTDVPRADTIRQRLRRPWDQVLRAALAPAAERGHVLGRGHGRESEFIGPEALALAGLRSVAHALGGPPSSDAYDAELSRRGRARERRALAPLLLPVAATLIGRFGSWQKALAAAGLDAGQIAARAGQRTNRAPAAEQTLSALVDLVGVLPSLDYLERYCRAHSIPLGRDARPYAKLVERVRALRTGQAKPTPDTITPPRRCPPFPGPIAGAARRPRAKGRPRTAILASLARYGERHLAPGQRPTERHYRACRELDPELISPSSFPAGERFQDLCREAGL
jgi:hypothetical protein